jgi:hypothetical protein
MVRKNAVDIEEIKKESIMRTNMILWIINKFNIKISVTRLETTVLTINRNLKRKKGKRKKRNKKMMY